MKNDTTIEYIRISNKSPADVFSYLLMIIMLYVGVVSFVAMLWQYINISFPDILQGSYYYVGATDIIRNSISSLLIVWPILVLISWMIGKDLRANIEKKELRVRKWLLYLTLFVASLTIVIDLIQLINSFLNGELTTRFTLKVLVVLVVAVAVFGFYLWDLKRDPAVKSLVSKYAAIGSSALILISIIGGFFLIGSPATQRAIRLDQQRTNDLQTIQSQILNYWTQKAEIPKNLDTLKDPLFGYSAPVDPQTQQSYEYSVKGVYEFELCATFLKKSDTAGHAGKYPYPEMAMAPYGGDNPANNIWNHEAGRVCFKRTIDPDFYKPNPQTTDMMKR